MKPTTLGSLLARLRWDKATLEERAEQGRKMAAGRRRKRLHARAKARRVK